MQVEASARSRANYPKSITGLAIRLAQSVSGPASVAAVVAIEPGDRTLLDLVVFPGIALLYWRNSRLDRERLRRQRIQGW